MAKRKRKKKRKSKSRKKKRIKRKKRKAFSGKKDSWCWKSNERIFSR